MFDTTLVSFRLIFLVKEIWSTTWGLKQFHLRINMSKSAAEKSLDGPKVSYGEVPSGSVIGGSKTIIQQQNSHFLVQRKCQETCHPLMSVEDQILL